MKTSPTPYMTQATARELLRISRERTAALREQRGLVEQLQRIGWDRNAALELARIGLEMKK